MNQTSSDQQPRDRATRANLGFLLAKASQRWNELLYAHFSERGYGEVRPAYGSLLLPLFEQDGLRMGELAPSGAAGEADDDHHGPAARARRARAP